MKRMFRQYILAAMLTASAGNLMAQEMNSAYFTDDFKYRHDMNPAFGNEQGYAAVPVLGNFNFRLQGSLGVGDVLFKNPDYGVKPGAKKTTTFMHPDISASEALKGFDKDGNSIIFDIDLPIVSVGFNGWDGYNTIELKERTHVAMSLPYEFFEFAKNVRNDDYSFDDLSARGWSYMELGFGHSRRIFDNLRVGAKVKLLFGVARGEFSMDGVHANLVGDQWVIEGKARAELNMNGAKWKEKQENYKSLPGSYNRVDGIDTDGAGLGGFGLGLDLGGIYEFKDCSVEELNGLKVSLALTDLGFINWSNSLVAESSGKKFVFDGFEMGYKDQDDGTRKFENNSEEIGDKLADFANLESKGDDGGKTHALASTMRLGIEYPMPFYDKLSAGVLYTHRFDGDYSWSEGRISANCKPLKWIDGGINVAFTSFCTTMGWVLNLHPAGMNVFLGMDHMIGKTGASMIPLDSNVSFNFGMNVAWGGKKKDDKSRKTLTF